MKNKLLALFWLIILSFTSYAQPPSSIGGKYPSYSEIGGQNRLTYIYGATKFQKGAINAIYADTASANLDKIKHYPGAQIVVADSVFIRDITATKWINLGSAGWGTKLNTGLNDTIHAIGTTDSTGLTFKVHNTIAGRIMPNYQYFDAYYNGSMGYRAYVGNTSLGAGALMYSRGGGHTAFGASALREMRDTTGAGANVAFGLGAGRDNRHGYRSTYLGYYAGFQGWGGSHNFYGGVFAGEVQAGGTMNTGTGAESMRGIKRGSYNSGYGGWSNYRLTTIIDSVTITSGGSGYTTATVTFSAPMSASPGTISTQATGTAVISGGAVVGVTMTERGSGYADEREPVTVTITGDGTGATGTVVLKSGTGITGLGFGAGFNDYSGEYDTYVGYLSGYDGNKHFYDRFNSYFGSYSSRSTSVSSLTRIEKSTAIGYNAKVGKSKNLVLGATGADQPTVVIGGDTARAFNSFATSYLLDVNGNIRTSALVHEETGAGYGNYMSMSQNYKGFPNITFVLGLGSSNPLNEGAFGISSLFGVVTIGTMNNADHRRLNIQNYTGTRAISFQQIRELARFADTTGNLLINTTTDEKNNYFLQVAGKTLLKDTVTISGQINAINIPASGTSTDSALAINRSTGYLEMRPVSGSGGFGDGIVSLGNSPYGLTKPNDSTYTADTTQLATILQTQHRIDSLAALKLAITDTTGQWIGSGWLASLVKYVDTTTVIATRTWVQAQGYLDYIPTFQQTLTAGSQLTNNAFIDANALSFRVDSLNTSTQSSGFTTKTNPVFNTKASLLIGSTDVTTTMNNTVLGYSTTFSFGDRNIALMMNGRNGSSDFRMRDDNEVDVGFYLNPPKGIIKNDTLLAASSMVNRVVMVRDTVNKRWEQISTDSVGKKFGVEDVTASANRTFNLNNYKFDLDSGSFHIKRKVTGQRSDDIFSVGIGATKSFYVNEVGNVYATELFAGSGSFSAIGGLVSLNSSTVRLNGSTTFNSFQKKFEFIKEWPAIDSIGFEIKNDTSGISTLPATWADTYKMLSLKYRSGVDNSLTERFDFRGNGDFNITGTGAMKINVGNTAQRPSSAVAGMVRFNSDSIGTGSALEVYNGTDWVHLGSSGGGGSDGYVDNATFNTTTNYLTIEQTGAADVSVRIPPSYILNTIHPDSTGFILNDSTFRLKAITVTTNNNRLTTTTTRTDSTLNFLVDIKRDTVTLASFGGGGGQAGDTTAFSTSTIYGSFYNDGTDTLVITSMRGVLQGTSPSVTYDVYYNDSLNVTAGASKLVTAGTALTNTATGAAVTSFDNTKIPPGVWVWVKTTTVTTKPTYFSLSLIGYKSRI